jgi:hypothetical protein
MTNFVNSGGRRHAAEVMASLRQNASGFTKQTMRYEILRNQRSYDVRWRKMAAEGEEGKSRRHLPRLSSRVHHHRFRPSVFDRTAAHLLCWKCENTRSSDILDTLSSFDCYPWSTSTQRASSGPLPADAAVDRKTSRVQRSVRLGEHIFLCT